MFIIIVGLLAFMYINSSSSKSSRSEEAREAAEEQTEQTTDPVVSYDAEVVTEVVTEAVTEAQTQAEENVHGSISLDNSGSGSAPANTSAVLTDNDKAVLSDIMQFYCENLCEAINTGEYSYVESFIKSGSPLDNMQRSLVSNLYSKGTTESLEWVTIKQYVPDSTGKTCTLYVSESETITSVSKGTYTESYNWKYTAVNDDDYGWVLTNIE
jgi:hypothetical protein